MEIPISPLIGGKVDFLSSLSGKKWGFSFGQAVLDCARHQITHLISGSDGDIQTNEYLEVDN